MRCHVHLRRAVPASCANTQALSNERHILLVRPALELHSYPHSFACPLAGK